ncbi:MAG: 2-oxoglutarate and iron-dependent oxygenase domain-containing protein, partial [Actinobacteria bacterium]|nr:2-oxoglutarate and iron-dependent oxygenase domain-containing protein [Actinomycetota bacterium]
MDIPIIRLGSPDAPRAIDAACRTTGFFALSDHGVDVAARERLIGTARQVFALPRSRKEVVSLAHGGTAWRGWFPLEGELTSGVADLKEGYY